MDKRALRVDILNPVSLRYWGGQEQSMVLAARALSARGHKVGICALPYTHKGVRVQDAKLRELLGEGISYSESWRIPARGDIAYAAYQPMFRLFIAQSCPMIAGMHVASIHYLWNLRTAVYRMAGRWDLAGYDAVRLLNDSVSVPHRHTYRIPNWIDTHEWRPVAGKRDPFTILFVGQRDREKGWDTFLDVSRELKSRNLPMEFWAAGGAESVGGVSGLGYITGEALAAAYSQAHLTVYPSRADMFSRVIMESCACGTPVLTTPIPAHKVQLPLLFAASTEEFTSKVMQMADLWARRPEEYLAQAAAARQSVIDKYDVSVVVPAFERMLYEIAGNDSAARDCQEPRPARDEGS